MFPVEQIFWYWFDQWWDLCERQRRALEVLRTRLGPEPPPPPRTNEPLRLVVDNTRR